MQLIVVHALKVAHPANHRGAIAALWIGDGLQLLVEPGRRIFIDPFAALGPDGLDFTNEFAITEVGAFQQLGT
ncbi:hypothetical protein D3C80_1973520 [compost metagenome]